VEPGSGQSAEPVYYSDDKSFLYLVEYQDALIAHLPEMGEAQAGRTSPPNTQGWLYLRDLAQQWLSGPGDAIKPATENNGVEDNGRGAPAWLSWDWLLHYERFSRAVTEILKEDYVFSAAALNKLTAILEQEGAFSGFGQPFNHIDQDWTAWRAHAFQGYSVNTWWGVLDEEAWSQSTVLPDGLITALGAFTIYARAAGRTYKNGNTWRVDIERVALFVYDGFEFSGDQWLGKWRYGEEYKGFDLVLGIGLENSDFRDFRARNGVGQDFRLLSCPPNDFIKVKSYDKL
jgi:hypothetical protein